MVAVETTADGDIREPRQRRPIAVCARLAGRAWLWFGRQTFNPVFVRDARSMFRGRRIFGLQLLYVIALMAVMGISSWVLYETRSARAGSHASLADFGQWIFIGVYETQAVLLMLIVVAYSAGAISLEREKQTYDVLAITSLTSAEVVLGKIAAIVALCYLLLLTSAPLAAFSLLFGGVSPADLVTCYGLLALKIPLWAGLGVLSSILAGRSIGAHVLALIMVGAENVFAVLLMDPFSGNDPVNLFNPLVAPLAIIDGIGYRLLSWPIPGWLLAIPYSLLLAALVIVGAAEAMPSYRPQRSALLRSLLLATAFFVVFLMTAIVAAAQHGQPGDLPLVGILALVWMWAAAFVPVFTSYPVSADEEKEGLGWSAIGPARWLERDARSGGGFCLLLWGVTLAGALLAAVLSFISFPAVRLPRQWPPAPNLVVGLAVLALSLIAYSAWGVTLAVIHRARREAAFAVLLIMLAMNSCAAVYAAGYHLLRKVPSAPWLVLASPVASASVIFSYAGPTSTWHRFTPEQALGYGLGYSLALLLGAYWYYRMVKARQGAKHGG